MMKRFLHTLVAVMFATVAVAQTYPSPTVNNITVQGDLNLPSKPANQVLVSPNAAPGNPTFRSLVPGDIPSLDAAKVTTGAFADARIPSLDAAKITSGAFADARIPSLDAAKIATGILPVARGGTGVATSTGTGDNVLSASPQLSGGVRISAPVGNARSLDFATSGVNRWTIRPNATAEAGSNAGSDLEVVRRDDAGTALGTPIFIRRSDGQVGINTTAPTEPLTVSGNARITGGMTVLGTIASTLPTFTTGATIDGAAATNRNLRFTTAGALRWQNITNNNAESGSNAGSNYSIARYDDAGSFLSIPFWITRSSGNVGINQTAPAANLDVNGTFNVSGVATAPTAAPGTNTTQIATTAFVLANNATPNFGTQTANTVFAGPTSGGAAAPTFRTMVANDIPALDAAKITTGTLPVARGGTGVTTSTGSGNSVLSSAPTFDNQILINGAAGSDRRILFQTGGLGRWNVRTSSEAESGSNAGSNLVYTSRDDSGNDIATVLYMRRSDGNVGINTTTPSAKLDVNGTFNVTSSATAPTASVGDNDTTIATTAFVSQNKGVADLRDYGGSCNGAGFTALTDAQSWSATYGAPIQVSCAYSISSDITVSSDIQFIGGGRFDVANGVTVTFTGNVTVANMMANDVFGGLGNVVFTNSKAKLISACWFGACDGSADVADNIRKMFTSGMGGKNIVFPGGTYNLCTSVAPGYPATNNSSVIIRNLSGFKVDAESYGLATFTSCASVAQNIAFLIDENDDWEWKGGAFVGSRSGLATTTVNAPFQLMNNQRFRLHKARAVSGYHDAGAFFEGDFNREFVIEDNIGFAGQGVDMAHSENGVYRNNTFTGQSSDASNIGLKCFSHINDGPLAGLGTTGVTNARNVTVQGNRCEKFISGIVLQNGTHWKIRDNYLLNINGKDASPGVGILINYVNGGSFSTVGNPVWNVSIEGNHMDGIGNVVAGCGINIGANAITNSDAINRIIIDGNMMSGTSGSRGVCADTTSTAKIANVFVGINEYSVLGALFDANMPTHAKPATLPR